MRKKLIIGLILYLGTLVSTFSQSLQLDFLFSSGLTYSSEFHGAAQVNDSVDFNFNKHQLQFVLPLKTKINLDLKKLDFKKMNLSSSQLFLTSKIGLNQSSFTDKSSNTIYKASIGITGLNAGLRQGVWIYSANLFIDESDKSYNGNLVPNFRGYGARVKVKSFDFIYFYGAGLVVNQGKFFPVPILGFQKKVAKNLKARIVFPIEAKLNYKANAKLNFDVGANFDGVNTIYRSGSVFKDTDGSINYRQLKSYIAINSKIAKQVKLKLEGGLSVAQQYAMIHKDYSENIGTSYYIAFTLNYQFGKSLFGQFVNPQ
ncbi:MAG: hypothetical protein H6587_01310 [Flavobacteriales bacterium]|nr:hypothetical protein [Flavobacteriales bacterium]MCB9363183.1 hypothetical protein [Flavobacteriales bacterium]